MKDSLWRALRTYTKTKGTVPLDERQMDALKNQYMELAKSVIIGFMVFMIFYGYMDIRDGETSIPYIVLASSLLGTITYYYTLRFCYIGVIGFDTNFESVLVPALLLTPLMLLHTILRVIDMLSPNIKYPSLLIFCVYALLMLLTYIGANTVYKRGKIQVESELTKGELRYRSRKQFVNYGIYIIVIIACLPLSYDETFIFFLVSGSLFVISTSIYYGFMDPYNVYIVNELGIRYHKALWNKKGGFIAYENIDSISQQDTFNIGFAKDKVKITCKNGDIIILYPENAYQFCIEVKNNV